MKVQGASFQRAQQCAFFDTDKCEQQLDCLSFLDCKRLFCL